MCYNELMEKCVESWLGKDNALSGVLSYIMAFMPLIISVIASLVAYKLIRKRLSGNKAVEIHAKIVEVAQNAHTNEDGTVTKDDGQTITYQYEYNGQPFSHSLAIPYVVKPFNVGDDFRITVDADNPDVEIPMNKLATANVMAIMAAMLIFGGLISILLSLGKSLCK